MRFRLLRIHWRQSNFYHSSGAQHAQFDGTSYWNALVATADGIQFKWLPAFWRGAETLPTIRTRVGGGGLIFNGAAQTGVPAASRYESNPDALEVYLAV